MFFILRTAKLALLLCAACAVCLGVAGLAGVAAGNHRSLEATPAGLTAHAAGFSDRFGDGTPDFLRLDSAPDRKAFRDSFVALAEYQAVRPENEVPGEIGDCAALLRFAYRNALHAHDAAWIAEQGEEFASSPHIAKYTYPNTPLAAFLFRTTSGPYLPGEERRGFSEFADARTLFRFNTFLVSRDIRDAQPGDLLFFRQLEQSEPYHSMVFVGRSRFAPELKDDLVVYHTGPLNGRNGEIRRVRVADLVQHPSPRWRPLKGNPNFLGVYRWNILREAD
jgi:uncharacterized protein YfaT (DUF1175 family)